MNFKEFASKVMNDEQSLKKINEAADRSAAYASACELGFSGTEKEFEEGQNRLRKGEILDQEINKSDLLAVAGGGPRCAPSVCADTYNPGENCALDDECNHFLNFYPH